MRECDKELERRGARLKARDYFVVASKYCASSLLTMGGGAGLASAFVMMLRNRVGKMELDRKSSQHRIIVETRAKGTMGSIAW